MLHLSRKLDNSLLRRRVVVLVMLLQMAEIDIPRSPALCLLFNAILGRRLEWLFTHNVNTKTPPGAAARRRRSSFPPIFIQQSLRDGLPFNVAIVVLYLSQHTRPMREKLMRANIYHQVESPLLLFYPDYSDFFRQNIYRIEQELLFRLLAMR